MSRISRSIRIQDVAKAAGVSVTTVSRVLNNKDDVSPETFERVQLVVDELGYTSSLAARGMRSYRTQVIGIILPDVTSPYCFEVLRGVNKAISAVDYDLIVYTNGRSFSEYASEKSLRYVNLLNGSVVDGVVVVTPTLRQFPTHAPLVIIDPNNQDSSVPALISTNREGALSMMHYLTDLGHRKIGFITGRMELISAVLRKQGYEDGLAAAGIDYCEAYVREGDYRTDTAVRCARELMTLADPPTAIFASNDMSAIGIYEAANELGIRIPEDLSVVGFDNLPEVLTIHPPLTTIDQGIRLMGEMAIQLILRLIQGEVLEKNMFVVPTQLIERCSCRSLATKKT
jgi:LacI family transcriptional regulator